MPTDAATVMLLRSCRDAGVTDIEVLLVQRNEKSHFVPGYYVFPGGALEAEDYGSGVDRFVRGINRNEAQQIISDMSSPAKSLGAWVAGIRETFEEVGILIAQKENSAAAAIRTEGDCKQFCDYRKALLAGKINFFQILAEEGLVLPLDRLYYFSHWITPELLPIRYDVRFFVTEVPANQMAVPDDVELTGHCWLRPCVALEQYEQGQIGMVLPQIMTLMEISRFRKVEEVIASARKINVPANLTKILQIDGREVEVMPDGSVFETRPPSYSWPDEEK